uniref:Uncharacterized protein n=1 Tax=Anguilla anguilla TaxID=7936 RepID=A0A0E9PER3_ANGAN
MTSKLGPHRVHTEALEVKYSSSASSRIF